MIRPARVGARAANGQGCFRAPQNTQACINLKRAGGVQSTVISHTAEDPGWSP